MISITDLVVRDRSRQALTCPLVVLGAGARAFIADAAGSDEDVATLELGRVAGWSLSVALFALDVETDEATWRDSIQATSWWVIASPGPADDPVWAKRFEETTRLLDAQRRDVVLGLAGPPSIAQAWRAYGGPSPIVHDLRARPVLRVLTRDFVRRVET